MRSLRGLGRASADFGSRGEEKLEPPHVGCYEINYSELVRDGNMPSLPSVNSGLVRSLALPSGCRRIGEGSGFFEDFLGGKRRRLSFMKLRTKYGVILRAGAIVC